jgi:hypothetical protein
MLCIHDLMTSDYSIVTHLIIFIDKRHFDDFMTQLFIT